MPARQVLELAHDDMALVRGALARDAGAFRAIMTRHNRRLYRIARSIVGNDGEAEDVLQDAYLSAFANLGGFRGDATLATWLSRIVINEALGRLRRRRRAPTVPLPDEPVMEAQVIPFPGKAEDPERGMAQRQILALIERATDSLPENFRTVLVARAIEGLSIEETADLLGIKPETVKTRLHRARKLLRERLEDEIGPVLLDAFPFAGRRCQRITEAVIGRLGV